MADKSYKPSALTFDTQTRAYINRHETLSAVRSPLFAGLVWNLYLNLNQNEWVHRTTTTTYLLTQKFARQT